MIVVYLPRSRNTPLSFGGGSDLVADLFVRVDFCDLEEHFEAWNLLTDTRVRVLWRVAVMPSGNVAGRGVHSLKSGVISFEWRM
jgi:hypothetical protein